MILFFFPYVHVSRDVFRVLRLLSAPLVRVCVCVRGFISCPLPYAFFYLSWIPHDIQ